MGIMSVSRRTRSELAAALVAILVIVGGCGGGDGGGESTATPTTPPVGKSSADRKKALEKEYGPGRIAPPPEAP